MLENTKKDKSQNSKNNIKNLPKRAKTKTILHLQIIFKLQKIKDEENILKKVKGNRHLTYRRAKIRIIPKFSGSMQASKKKAERNIYSVEIKTKNLELFILQNYLSKKKENDFLK